MVDTVGISDGMLEEARASILKGTGLPVPLEGVASMLYDSPHSYDELRQEVRDGFSSDTSVREQLADMLALELVGRRWPANLENLSPEEMDAFYANLSQAARECGWLHETMELRASSRP